MPVREAFKRALAHKKNILTVLLGQGAAMIGVAVGTRLLTEVASTSSYGEARLALGVIGLFSGVILRPFTQFAMREYHDAENINRIPEFEAFARPILFKVAVALGLLVMLGLVLYQVAIGKLSVLLSVSAGGYLVGEAMWRLESSLMITRNRQIAASIMQVAEQWGLPLIAAAGILFLGDSAANLVLFQAILWITGVTLLRRMKCASCAKQMDWFEKNQEAKWTTEAKRFVIPMVGLSVFTWIVNIGDRYILAYFYGAAVVGQYSAVYGLCSAPLIIMSGMTVRLLYPFWFRSAAQKKSSLEYKMFGGMIFFMAVFAMIAIATIALFGMQIMNLLLAADYRPGAQGLMVWIAAGYGTLVIASAYEMKAYASKRTFVITISYGVAAIVNIALNLIWIPQWGALGAARATFVAFTVYLLVMIALDMQVKGILVKKSPVETIR